MILPNHPSLKDVTLMNVITSTAASQGGSLADRKNRKHFTQGGLRRLDMLNQHSTRSNAIASKYIRSADATIGGPCSLLWWYPGSHEVFQFSKTPRIADMILAVRHSFGMLK